MFSVICVAFVALLVWPTMWVLRVWWLVAGSMACLRCDFVVVCVACWLLGCGGIFVCCWLAVV